MSKIIKVLKAWFIALSCGMEVRVGRAFSPYGFLWGAPAVGLVVPL